MKNIPLIEDDTADDPYVGFAIGIIDRMPDDILHRALQFLADPEDEQTPLEIAAEIAALIDQETDGCQAVVIGDRRSAVLLALYDRSDAQVVGAIVDAALDDSLSPLFH